MRRVIPHFAASERSCDFCAFEGRPAGLDSPYVARQVCWAADSFANRLQIPHFFAASLTDALRLAPARMLAFAETRHDSCSAVMLMNLDEPPFPWAETPEAPMQLSESDRPMTLVAEIMRACGGDCGVDSIVGVGSTFWVEFPDS